MRSLLLGALALLLSGCAALGAVATAISTSASAVGVYQRYEDRQTQKALVKAVEALRQEIQQFREQEQQAREQGHK